MGERVVTLRIAKCGECPYLVRGYVRLFCRLKSELLEHGEQDSIPDWCPLPKDPDHA